MGQVFGPFVLDRLLGRGGMAEVFLARRRDDPSTLVIKRLRPELGNDSEQLQRLKLEATIAAKVVHPNLVRLHELGKVGECYYLAMEHVRGFSLKRLLDEVIDKDRPVPSGVAAHLARGIAAGLSAMHASKDEIGGSRPIVHRDVTPNNVIVTHDGRPVLIDFGIAKDVFGPGITQVGRIIGTARYMPPEQRMGQGVDPRSDVFSASMILFEMLTARHPWAPMPPHKELLRTIFDPPEIEEAIRARAPASLLAIALRGLEHDRHRRFADGGELERALAAEIPWGADPDRGGAEVRDWIASTGLPADEALGGAVIDSAVAKPVPVDRPIAWTPKGQVAPASEAQFEGRLSDLPSAKLITIPPLGPRIEEERTQELEIAADLGTLRFRRWAWALLAVIGAGLVALLVFAR